MNQRILAESISVVLSCVAALAQAPALAQAKGNGPAPGVSPLRIMERPQVRASGVGRLFVPLSGKIGLTRNTADPSTALEIFIKDPDTKTVAKALALAGKK